MKIETTFMGRRFYFGVFRGERGKLIDEEVYRLRAEIREKSMLEFSERMISFIRHTNKEEEVNG